MIDWDEVFEGAVVPAWLREFAADPCDALEDLLTGRADLGMLNTAEPMEVLLDWLDRIGDRAPFASQLDSALANWIERSWGDPSLEKAAHSSALTAVAWSRAGFLIEHGESLRESADALRSRVTGDKYFLNSITEGRSRDPQGQAWLAIAQYQEDRSLLDAWWRLCSLPPDEPWFRGVFGIYGLRRVPNGGGLPSEVAEGLSVLGRALNRRVEEGWLGEDVARNEFLRISRMTMAAYPLPNQWEAFWRNAMHRQLHPPEEWVQDLANLGQEREGRRANTHVAWASPDPQWTERARRIASTLVHPDDGAIEQARGLLTDEALYAAATGDCYHVVRSACNFAGRVMETRPDLACDWAELARHFDPWNAYAWTTSGQALLYLDRLDEALRVGIEAVERFPDNVVARTGLAEILKAQDRLEEAEGLYRGTIERFPDNVVARTGLAEVLKAQGGLDEAEAVYRDTITRFPDNVVARTGLAEVLKAQGELDEAEAMYRGTMKRFPDNVHARTGLAEVLKAQGRLDGAKETYRDAIQRFPDNVVARNGLDEVLRLVEEAKDTESIASATPTLEDGHTPGHKPTRPGRRLARTMQATREPGEKGGEARPEASPREPSQGLRSEDVEILLTDAHLLRKIGRVLGETHGRQSVDDRIRRALQSLIVEGGSSSRAAGEAGMLFLMGGELDEAVAILREARERFPGSARVKYALARAQRELAARDGRLLIDAELDVIAPLRELTRLDARYRPIELLGESRGYLALKDGQRVRDKSISAFGKLGKWLSKRADSVTSSEDSDDESPVLIRGSEEQRFLEWWARQVQDHVFGELTVRRAEDIEDFDSLAAQTSGSKDKLDQLEEEYIFKYALV